MSKILMMKDIDKLKDYVSSDIFSRLLTNRPVCLALQEGSFLISFHFRDIRNQSRKDDRVCIYCGKDELAFVSDNKRCIELISDTDKKADNYSQLITFFSSLTANDVYEMEKIEDRITDLEDSLLTDVKIRSDKSDIIINLRRELLKMKRYYEQLSLISGELAENANSAFSVDMQKRFTSLDKRIDYLLNSVLHLREYITQVREAYQAQIDIEQNQIMKVFTVITSVFLPLTLIVGWYGMNLQMPEFGWKYGYPFVMLLSVVVCVSAIILFKKKKWY